MSTLASGTRLHWYEVKAVIGQGGFGVTYDAVDCNLGRTVALKEFFPSDCARRDDDGEVRPHTDGAMQESYRWGLERFLQEARTLAALQHPNIVRVQSVFEANGTAYMVMDMERGIGLDHIIVNNRIDNEAALLGIALPLLDGLDHIHRAGFIHRDVKPSNVLLRESDGSPVLLDFGSARQAGGAHGRQLTSVVSRGYAPFEQYSTVSQLQQGPWTDIYGMAATLYHIVAGRAPSDAMNRGTLQLEGSGDAYVPVRPRDGGTYSPRLLAAIDRGLAFKGADRPQSIGDWRAMFPAGGRLQAPSDGASPPGAAGAVDDAVTTEVVLDTRARSVLIVDDEPFVRSLARRVIKNLGIGKVYEAGDGGTALEMLADADFHPDVILLDLNMPGMDGVEILRHLGERQIRCGLIVVSGEGARVLETATALAASHGLYVLGAIEKPIKPMPLLTALAPFDPLRSRQRTPQAAEPLSENDLLEGMHSGALAVVYQPAVALRERKVIGVEALARWRHPTRGLLEPAAFVPVAEAHGHIDALTEQVFAASMAQAGAWQAAGLAIAMAVNFSVASLSHLALPDRLATLAAREGVDLRSVTLEVTERRVILDVRIHLEVLTRLRLRGVRLSIDDFGTGHSSLEQVRRAPFHELKVDRAFVTGAADDRAASAILESSAALAHRLGLFLVAEGVESERDLELVNAVRCDAAQGFHISRPLEAAAIPDFITDWARG